MSNDHIKNEIISNEAPETEEFDELVKYTGSGFLSGIVIGIILDYFGFQKARWGSEFSGHLPVMVKASLWVCFRFSNASDGKAVRWRRPLAEENSSECYFPGLMIGLADWRG